MYSDKLQAAACDARPPSPPPGRAFCARSALQGRGGGILVEAFSNGVVIVVRIIASVFANCSAAAESSAVRTHTTAAPLPAPLPVALAVGGRVGVAADDRTPLAAKD